MDGAQPLRERNAGAGAVPALKRARPPPPPPHQRSPPPLDLTEWGVPAGVARAYAAAGVPRLYAWQAAAVAAGASGGSLIVAAPTSGGKSLVAEVLVARALAAAAAAAPRGAPPPRAALVLPYASIVAEKARHLATVFAPAGWTVHGYLAGAAGRARAPLAARAGETVAVLTIEKFNAAATALSSAGRLGELAAVVVDEAHMVADGGRGAALESALAKLLTRATGAGATHVYPLQIVAMSATMAGLDAAAAWLGARLFLTDHRPTPLAEHVAIGREIYGLIKGVGLTPQPVRMLPAVGRGGGDALAALVCEAAAAAAPVLVFCASRASTEACAARLAVALTASLPPPDPRLAAARSAAASALAAATGGGRGAAATLATLFPAGVAFHHAGLTSAERGAVEAGFRAGALACLAATSTLAAGVNLPAARVVLRSLAQGGGGTIPRGHYVQMVGRAGRAGLAAAGESYVLCEPAARADAAALLTAPLPALASRLLDPDATGATPLDRLLLDGVAAAGGAAPAALAALVRATLAARDPALGPAAVAAAAGESLKRLRARGLVSFAAPCAPRRPPPTRAASGVFAGGDDSPPPPPPLPVWTPTPRGRAVAAACLPVADAEALVDAVARVADACPLDAPTALLWAVLPATGAMRGPLSIRNWGAWAAALERGLGGAGGRAAAAVGVLPSHAADRARRGAVDAGADADHCRLLAAVVATSLLDEAPPVAVSARWALVTAPVGADDPEPVPAGALQHLLADAGTRAALGAAAASAAGWPLAAQALASLADRCAAGCRPDLAPLVAAIPSLDAARARALSDAGLGSLRAIARAAEERLSRALLASLRLPRAADGTAAPAGAAWTAWAAKTAAAVKRGALAALDAADAEAAASAAAGGGVSQWSVATRA